MNIEQKRAYIENIKGMSDLNLFRESRKLCWRVNLGGYGLVGSWVSYLGFVAVGVAQNMLALSLIPGAVGLPAMYGFKRIFEEGTQRNNIVNFEFQRRGLSMRLSSFERIGIALVRSASTPSDIP